MEVDTFIFPVKRCTPTSQEESTGMRKPCRGKEGKRKKTASSKLAPRRAAGAVLDC